MDEYLHQLINLYSILQPDGIPRRAFFMHQIQNRGGTFGAAPESKQNLIKDK